jgi:uncharacterized protein (TIGR00369 family)
VDFPSYDPEIAEQILHAPNHHAGGLTEMLDVTTVAVAPGTVTCRLPVTDRLLNRHGAAHGGVVSALVDHVLGTVCVPLIPRGAWPATTEYKLNLLAPGKPGAMDATATILSLTRRTAVVRIDVVNQGRTIALAQGTVTIMPPREAPPA